MVVQLRTSSRLPTSEPDQEVVAARIARSALNKQKQAEDAPKAMQEYRAAEEAVRLKTERLRAARLARV